MGFYQHRFRPDPCGTARLRDGYAPRRGPSCRAAPMAMPVTPFSDETAYCLPLPARYVVDRQGQIRAADVNADYTVRPDPAETLAQLRGLSPNSKRPAARA